MGQVAGLKVHCFGGVHIWLDGTAVTGFPSRKADALLIYLACTPRPHPRETLATLLWPENDQTRALANLSVILSSLRKALGNYVLADRHTIAFNTEQAVQLDVSEFIQAIDAAQAHQQSEKITRTVAAQLQTAVSHYKGDFLAGFNLRGVPEFEAWVLLEQERLRQMMLDALAKLIRFHQQRGQISEGIQVAQQLLALDPLQEETHRQLMQLYAQDNQRPAALAQYEQCAAILADELGVEPDEETTQLYEAIKSDKVKNQQTVTSSPGHLATPSPAHNLPTPSTSFIGRKNELAQIEDWLRQADGRLLTIIGPGGMGKTRLAQEAARNQLGVFADGIWFVSLVAFTDLNGVVTAVAEAIGLAFSGQEPIATQLQNQLKSAEILLILDNLEHLLSAELRDFLSQLVQAAPELRLIATSRERLNIQAESLLALHGLPYPAISDRYSASHNPDPIANYPAVQLFTNRVQRIQANLDLVDQETAVVHLCNLVGGLPLALELAATWTRVLAIPEIVTEIQRGLDALSTTLHDLPARHRSLRAVIETSWQLLTPDEQQLFRQLAIFRGGFTRTAAQQVANATPQQLLSLVDRSFLRLDKDHRFRRHPLLLQFGQEQLAAHSPEKAQTEAAHARFFADFLQQRETALTAEGSQEALDAIGTELENIRAAWQWSVQAVAEPLLTPLITNVSRFFTDRSRYLEGVELFQNGLQAAAKWEETAVSERITARMQVELGFFLFQTGQYAAAETILQNANKLTEKHGLTQARLSCLKHLGDVLGGQGDRTRAKTIVAEALHLCRASQAADRLLEMTLLNTLGNLEVSDGNYATARSHFDQAMAIAQTLNHTLRIAILHNNMAIIANREDDFDEALRQYKLARDGFARNNHEWGIAATTHNISMVYAELGRYDEALATVQEAYAAHEKIGHRRGMVGGLSFMGTVYFKLGKRREARRHYFKSLQMAQEVGVAWSAVATLVDVAELELSYGRIEQAAKLLTFAAQHEAIVAVTLEKAQKLLDELKMELPQAQLDGMETAVASLTLDEIIAQVTQAS